MSPSDRAGAQRAAGRPVRAPALAVLAALLVLAPVGSLMATDLSSVPLPTYQTGTTADIKPNILMVLDDSGSMDWDYLPDWANDRPSNYSSLPQYITRNASFNGVAYNPAVRYLPPVGFNANGTKDTTTYPSMVGTSAATGADTAQTMPNWRNVKNDGFGVQSTNRSNLTTSAYFYTTVAGEYCDSPQMTNCQTASAPSGLFQYAAPLRWCSNQNLTTCRGLQDSTYRNPRMPAPRMATIVVDSAGSTSYVSGITVDGLEIMAAATAQTGNESTAAGYVRDQINACTLIRTGNCQVVGYSASSSGTTLRIYAPGAVSATPVVNKSGTFNTTITAFSRRSVPLPDWSDGGTVSSSTIPGENLLTVITPSVTSYPYPGTNAKAAARTDCAGTTCTYNEEMTNYANWWAYYRTRMQMMKTSTSRAFSVLDNDIDIAANVTRYRVGYLSLNNNTGSDFANIKDFDAAQKVTWFSKLFAAIPNNSTPLREALSKAGRLYGGKYNGSSLNGTTVTEPIQYSCQKNYTILSTDGFWNGNAGFRLDGSTAIGNTDGTLSRPYHDGGTAALQSRTSTLQQRTGQLQRRTSSNSGSSWTNWANVATCNPDNSGSSRTQCQTVYTNWTNVSSCTVQSTVDGTGKTTQCQYTAWTNWANVATCTAVGQGTAPNYTVGTARECQGIVTGGTSDTLADVAAYYYNTDLRDSAATGSEATGTCTGPVIPPSTTANDLCTNNVPAYGRDNNPKQHMTTHTLGLGAQGRMVYSPYQNDLQGNRVYLPDYWNQPTGDFFAVSNASTANPSGGICSWQGNGTTCTWPTPSADSPANIDDLWHAAVNGHGTYFSAQDPASLASALTVVLSQIVNEPRPGTAAAAASSNPNITNSDNFVFSSSYKSVDWYGELVMQRMGDAGLSRQRWSAMRLLDCATTVWAANKQWQQGQSFNRNGVCRLVMSDYASLDTYDQGNIDTENTLPLSGRPVTRTIYTRDSASATPALTPFAWGSLSATQKSYFEAPYINYVNATQGLTQFCTLGAACLSATAQTAASGQALVNYLRGDRTNEGTFFRRRAHVLGDIVSSEARYVKQPLPNFADVNFAAYKALHINRAPMVYVGANDGMLHAFDALTGEERWAYVPSAVLPEMYRLADSDYANKHRYFVDGSPEVGDICPSAPGTDCTDAAWRTILVGGLNQGGKSYYALDITDPATPRLMWEFTHADMGYSYSNPRIGKLKNGTWAVFIASGYNNADGAGRLFILNAATGALISTISTGQGTVANDGGLARLAGYASNAAQNFTYEEVYGADLLGNVWRFDINGDIGGSPAHRLTRLTDPSGVAQPVTAKPTLGIVTGKPLVMVGTGKYLGVNDLATTTVNTMYGIRDKLDTITLGSPRVSGSNFVAQTMVDADCPADAPTSVCQPGQTVRTVTANPVDWSVKNGWYTDFVLPGERSVTDATLALGTLVFTTIKPQTFTTEAIVGCTSSRTGTSAVSFLYYLDYQTGGAVAGTKNVVGEELCTCVATRPSVVRTASGALQGIIRTSGEATNDLGPTDNETYEGDQTDVAGCQNRTDATCGDSQGGSSGGGTKTENIPYKRSDGPPRRISWRELNGF